VIANPSLRTYGFLPRNTFRGPGPTNINMAFSKVTQVNEGLRVALRADFFGLLNRAKFRSPNTNFTSPTFGPVLSTLLAGGSSSFLCGLASRDAVRHWLRKIANQNVLIR
jgi:hypothetical protein